MSGPGTSASKSKRPATGSGRSPHPSRRAQSAGRSERARIGPGGEIEDAPAAVADDLVRIAVDLEDAHRLARVAPRRVAPLGAGEAHRGGDARRELAREAMREEAAVGVPGDVDARRVDGHLRGDVVEDPAHVPDVVGALDVEVAARVRRVPEAAAVRVGRAVGSDEDEARLVGQRVHPEAVRVLLSSRRAVPVEEEDERSGLAAIPAGRDVDRVGPGGERRDGGGRRGRRRGRPVRRGARRGAVRPAGGQGEEADGRESAQARASRGTR